MTELYDQDSDRGYGWHPEVLEMAGLDLDDGLGGYAEVADSLWQGFNSMIGVGAPSSVRRAAGMPVGSVAATVRAACKILEVARGGIDEMGWLYDEAWFDPGHEVVGALHWAIGVTGDFRSDRPCRMALSALDRVASPSACVPSDSLSIEARLADWNGRVPRSIDDVLAVFDSAIASLGCGPSGQGDLTVAAEPSTMTDANADKGAS